MPTSPSDPRRDLTADPEDIAAAARYQAELRRRGSRAALTEDERNNLDQQLYEVFLRFEDSDDPADLAELRALVESGARTDAFVNYELGRRNIAQVVENWISRPGVERRTGQRIPRWPHPVRSRDGDERLLEALRVISEAGPALIRNRYYVGNGGLPASSPATVGLVPPPADLGPRASSERQRRIVLDLLQHEKSPDLPDTRQGDQLLAMQHVEALHVARSDLQQVIEIPGHEVAVENLFHPANHLLELRKALRRRPVQHDADHHQRPQPHAGRRDLRPDRRYEPVLKQALRAPMTGRGTDIHQPGQIGIGDARVLLKRAQDIPVDPIQTRGERLFRHARTSQSCPAT